MFTKRDVEIIKRALSELSNRSENLQSAVNDVMIKVNNELMTKNKELYLSYVNDFLTVERFADYYGLDINKAHELIQNKGEV